MKNPKDIFVDGERSSKVLTDIIFPPPPKSIWVISDDAESSHEMKKLLSQKHNVRALKSTSAPIEQINDTEIKPHLIILDEAIEGSKEILEEAKTARIPTIFLQANNERKKISYLIYEEEKNKGGHIVTVIKTPIMNDAAFLRFIDKKLRQDSITASQTR